MKFLIGLFVLLLGMTPAMAQDCKSNDIFIKPALTGFKGHELDKSRTFHSERGRHSERGSLLDGAIIFYEAENCLNYNVQFSFQAVPKNIEKLPLKERALKLMEGMQVTNETTFLKAIITNMPKKLEPLEGNTRTEKEFIIPCEVGFKCVYTVKPEYVQLSFTGPN